jgi:hypothetical protein
MGKGRGTSSPRSAIDLTLSAHTFQTTASAKPLFLITIALSAHQAQCQRNSSQHEPRGAMARTGIIETQLVGGVEVDAVCLTGEADIPALLLDLLPALRVVQVIQVFSLLCAAPRNAASTWLNNVNTNY